MWPRLTNMSVPLHVYVIHAKFLGVRKPIIDTLFQKLTDSGHFDLTTDYITDFDPQDVLGIDIKSLIDLNKSKPNGDVFDGLVKNLHVKHLSNALKHKEVLKRISENKKYKGLSLVIEDDVVYGEDVANKLLSLANELTSRKSTWDICFLGLPQPVNSTQIDVIRPTSELFRVVPCIESYLIHGNGADKIYKEFHPIRFVANVHFSYLFFKNPSIQSYMSCSNLFIDGTKFGVYLSTLEPNSKLLLNSDYVKVAQIVLGKDVLTQDEMSATQTILENIKFKNHPDILTLHAILKEKQGKYKESKKLLDEAYNTYMSNECIINNESEFMIHYTRIFKYLQDEPIEELTTAPPEVAPVINVESA